MQDFGEISSAHDKCQKGIDECVVLTIVKV